MSQEKESIAKTVINQFGPKRVMFGSNFPVDSLSSSFDDLYKRLNNIIGIKNTEDIFFKTAQRTYFSKLSKLLRERVETFDPWQLDLPKITKDISSGG